MSNIIQILKNNENKAISSDKFNEILSALVICFSANDGNDYFIHEYEQVTNGYALIVSTKSTMSNTVEILQVLSFTDYRSALNEIVKISIIDHD